MFQRVRFLDSLAQTEQARQPCLNRIGGYIKPEFGKVYFDGQDITGLKPPAVARVGMGRTFQIVKSLTTLTVLENVVVGALLRNGRAKAYAKAEEIINLVGLKGLEDQLPGKSHPRVSQKA